MSRCLERSPPTTTTTSHSPSLPTHHLHLPPQPPLIHCHTRSMHFVGIIEQLLGSSREPDNGRYLDRKIKLRQEKQAVTTDLHKPTSECKKYLPAHYLSLYTEVFLNGNECQTLTTTTAQRNWKSTQNIAKAVSCAWQCFGCFSNSFVQW